MEPRQSGFKDPKLRMLGGQSDPTNDYEIIYKKNEYFDKLTTEEYQQLTRKSKQSFKKITGNTKWTYGEVPNPMTPISPWLDSSTPIEEQTEHE